MAGTMTPKKVAQAPGGKKTLKEGLLTVFERMGEGGEGNVGIRSSSAQTQEAEGTQRRKNWLSSSITFRCILALSEHRDEMVL